MQNIFRRYEKKYVITRDQYAVLKNTLSQHMRPDDYGDYLVQNLYYDTENWDIIRASIERPLFKEKMRLRCYGSLNQEDNLFLELKKKYEGIVYKRRIAIPVKTHTSKSVPSIVIEDDSQIARELNFYLKSNEVSEKIYISYRRSAFAGIMDEGVRITFDSDIRFRLDCLDFTCPDNGIAVLPQSKIVMEVKTFGSMPLWLSNMLSENLIFPSSYSKYGACYTDCICKNKEIERRAQISA